MLGLLLALGGTEGTSLGELEGGPGGSGPFTGALVGEEVGGLDGERVGGGEIVGDNVGDTVGDTVG